MPQLWTKHRNLARSIAKDFYIPGSDEDDVVQEAMIALWVAATDYDPSHGVPFKAFAAIVIRRRLASCVKIATRRKHEPLNLSLRTMMDHEGHPRDIAEVLPYFHTVVDIAEEHALLAVVIAAIDDKLSSFERHCVIGVASGSSYIALGPHKRVDNALNRARRKLRKAIETV